MNMLQKIAGKIQTVWSMLGIALLLLFGADAVLQRTLARRSEGAFAAFLKPYPDPDHGWVDQYLRESSEGDRAGWRPYVYWRRLPYGGETFKVESSGLRHTWNASYAPTDKVTRIFAFGGSTMWGTGSRADYNLPSWLSRYLNEAGHKVEVTNFGEGGYVSTQELLTLYLELRSGNVPDFAIFYDGINDVASAFQNKKAGWTQNESNRFTEFRADEKHSRLQKFIALLPGLQEFTAGLGRRLAKPYAINEADIGPLETDVVRIYRENVRVVETLGREYGFESLFYWQPTIFSKDMLSPSEIPRAASQSYIRDFMTGTYAALKADKTLSADPHLRDVSGIFRKTEFAVFADPFHLSERGNSIVARQIAEDVERRLTTLSHDNVPSAALRR